MDWIRQWEEPTKKRGPFFMKPSPEDQLSLSAFPFSCWADSAVFFFPFSGPSMPSCFSLPSHLKSSASHVTSTVPPKLFSFFVILSKSKNRGTEHHGFHLPPPLLHGSSSIFLSSSTQVSNPGSPKVTGESYLGRAPSLPHSLIQLNQEEKK